MDGGAPGKRVRHSGSRIINALAPNVFQIGHRSPERCELSRSLAMDQRLQCFVQQGRFISDAG